MKNKIKTLTNVEKNIPVKVIMLSNECKSRERLQSMGITAGATIKIITGEENNNLLVAIGNTRVAIEKEIANSILVQ